MCELLLLTMARGDRWHLQAGAAVRALASSISHTNAGPLLHSALYASSPAVRAAAVRALADVDGLGGALVLGDAALAASLWITTCDEDADVSACAARAWKIFEVGDADDDANGEAEVETELPVELEAQLLPLLSEEEPRVRKQAALSLASVARRNPSKQHPTLQRLFEVYKTALAADSAGSVDPRFAHLQEKKPEEWRPRHGVALVGMVGGG